MPRKTSAAASQVSRIKIILVSISKLHNTLSTPTSKNGFICMEANVSHFYLNIDGQSFPILRYDLKDYGLNSLFSLKLDLLTETEYTPDRFIRQKGHFKVVSEKTLYLNGVITACVVLPHYQDGYRYTLTMEPSLSLLHDEEQNECYTHTDLKKIFAFLFEKHRLLNVNYRFENIEIPFFLQYKQTDYHFFLTLIIQYGLIFYFEFDEHFETLIISDTLSSHYLFTLRLCDNQVLLKPDDCAYQLSEKMCLLADSLKINAIDARYKERDFEISTHNSTPYPGNKQHNITLPYACYEQSECERYAKRLQDSIDWQRHVLTTTTHQVNIKPGDRIQIVGFSHDIYRVLSIKGSGSESHSLAFSTENTSLKACHQLFLIDANITYRPYPSWLYDESLSHHWYDNDLLDNETKPPQSFLHTIKPLNPPPLSGIIAGTGNKPAITPNACYPVKLNLNPERIAYNVPMIQLSINPHKTAFFGVRFPLRANTKVMVGWLNGCPQQPFIIGCYPIHHRHTQYDNAHMIQTISGLGLRCSEKENRFELYTKGKEAQCEFLFKDEKLGIYFTHQTKKIYCETTQTFSLESIGKSVYETKQFTMKVGGHAVFNAKRHYLYANTIRWTINDSAYWQSDNLTLKGENHLSLQSEQLMDIKKSLFMLAHNISMSSKTHLILRGDKSLSIKCPGIQIEFSDSGVIRMNGQSLISATTHRLSPNCIVIKPD